MQKENEQTINALISGMSIRAGRANPTILDKVMVEYYGTPTPINQLAAVSVPEARTLLIRRGTTINKTTEKAIQTWISALTLNDGNSIRLIFPPLTEERRRELVKGVYKYAEGARSPYVRAGAMEKTADLKKKS